MSSRPRGIAGMKLALSSLFAFAILLEAPRVVAQHIAVVTVTASGYGTTEAEAVADAIVNGIAQVNGEAVAASLRMKKTSTEAVSDGKGTRSTQRSIEEDISRSTAGVVKSWRKLSAETSAANQSTASVSVNVVVLKRSRQLDRMKLAVVPSKQGETALTDMLAEELARNLTAGRKFSVMDRRHGAEVAEQLARIRQGRGAIEDKVRLTGEVAPDYIAVVSAEPPVMRAGGKSYLYGTVEIVDYATRQLKFSEKKIVPLKAGDEASNRRRVALLGKNLSRAIVQTVYPPTVVGQDGATITIAQGVDFFSRGDRIVIRKKGKPIRDPHTGEFLSNEQTDVVGAEIIAADARVSLARLDAAHVLDQKLMVDKKYLAWRTGESANDAFFADDGNSAGREKSKTGKLFLGDEEDDE